MKWFYLSLLIFFISCKKETTNNPDNQNPPILDTIPECEPIITPNYSYDTIYPSDYLMAYPGSWWEYDDGFIDSCNAWEEVFIHYTTTINGCKYVEQDVWVLPEKLSYHGGHIANNMSVFSPDNYDSSVFSKIYDTVSYTIEHDPLTGGESPNTYIAYTFTQMFEPIDSMEVNGTMYFDIVHKRGMAQFHYPDDYGPMYYTDYYFAKNIGMFYKVFSDDMSIFNEYKLVDYYIAPH